MIALKGHHHHWFLMWLTFKYILKKASEGMEGPGSSPGCVQGEGVAQQCPELVAAHYLPEGWTRTHHVHQTPNDLQHRNQTLTIQQTHIRTQTHTQT